MVTGTDTLLNDLLQKGLSETPPPRGKFLILPTLPLGTSEHHVPFGGTWTIPPILYTQVLAAMLRSLVRQGHTRIFLLNSHGGNQPSINTVLAELAQEATANGVLLGGASYWTLTQSAWDREIPDLKMKRVGHACEIEASLLMVARPDLPLRSRPAGHPSPAWIQEGWALAGDFSSLSPEGFLGYPREASLDKGRRLFQVAIRALGDFLSRYAERSIPRDLRTKKERGRNAGDE
jgi:creatinine amidohydrolase